MTDTNNTDATLANRAGTPYEGCACWFRDDLFEEVAKDCPAHGTDAINRALAEHVDRTFELLHQAITSPIRCDVCNGIGNLHWGDCTRKGTDQ